MFGFKKQFSAISFAAIFAGLVFAQPPPPAKTESNAVKIVQQPALKNLPATEKFSSADGRFTVALPRNISGFSALTPQNMGRNVSGSMFQWHLREGFVTISFYDILDPKFSVTTEQDFVNFFGGARDAALNSFKGKLVSESLLKSGEYRGHKFSFRLADDSTGIGRVFYVDKRAYMLLAVAAKNVPDAADLISQAFDTFALIKQKAIDAELRRKIEASTPKALPQEPSAKKEKSDAEDENLKGKIKSIVRENEDLSGTWSIQGRHFSSVEDYNEKGNLVKRLFFDSKGKPFMITVYGYIDGARVSDSNFIEYEGSPMRLSAAVAPAEREEKITKPADPRYEYKLEHKYADGKLSEMQMVFSNGKRGMRYVYNHRENQREELVYDTQGRLNQKFIYTLDEKGNEIERTDAAVLNYQQAEGDRKYSIKYEAFDEKGNWTKRVTSKLVTENGKQVYKPWYITYRTITYYQ